PLQRGKYEKTQHTVYADILRSTCLICAEILSQTAGHGVQLRAPDGAGTSKCICLRKTSFLAVQTLLVGCAVAGTDDLADQRFLVFQLRQDHRNGCGYFSDQFARIYYCMAAVPFFQWR